MCTRAGPKICHAQYATTTAQSAPAASVAVNAATRHARAGATAGRKSALRIAQEIKSVPRKAGDHVIVSIHWGGNWGYDIPREQETFAKTLIDQGGVDIVHGHSSHHPKRMEIYRGRLILYGAGDLINDYEGIGGYEEFRPELSLIYLPRLSASGAVESILLVPMRMQRFRLNRTTAEETAWLRRLMEQQSRGLQFEMTADGLILARPK